MTTDNNFIKKL